MEQSSNSVRVHIYGDEYPIKGSADPEHINRLANYVDEKMKGIAAKAQPRDKLKIAILAAFNIAGELFEKTGQPGTDAHKKLVEFQLKAEELDCKLSKHI